MDAVYNDIPLSDVYSVKIFVPANYPIRLPRAFLQGEELPKGFMHQCDDGSLCLGVVNDIYDKLDVNSDLLFFINEFVVGFLYSLTYYKRFGEPPYGERSHGILGVLEYYSEKMRADSAKELIPLLRAVADKWYRGHLPCPCGSTKKLRECHGQELLDAISKPRMVAGCSSLLKEIEAYVKHNHQGSPKRRI